MAERHAREAMQMTTVTDTAESSPPDQHQLAEPTMPSASVLSGLAEKYQSDLQKSAAFTMMRDWFRDAAHTAEMLSKTSERAIVLIERMAEWTHKFFERAEFKANTDLTSFHCDLPQDIAKCEQL